MSTTTLIGRPVHRAEDLRFLRGAGTFIDDLKREGMLHAVVLRSSVAHGRLRRIDASGARQAGRARHCHGAGYWEVVSTIPLRLANLPEFKNYP
jgi:carbon-monoxide dehydrogenase large subunit